MCKWTETVDGPWATGCGHIFEFYDGGPEENRQKFCGYCGEPIEVVKYVEPEDGDEDE